MEETFYTKNKPLIFLGIFFVFVMVFITVWFLFFKEKNIVAINNNPLNLPVTGENRDNSYTGDEYKNENDTELDDESPSSVLWHIYDKPVAGYGFSYDDATGTLLFVDKATGNIYKSVYNESSDSFDRVKISNTTFKDVSSAVFSVGGDYVMINYKNSKNLSESYVAKVPRTENTDSLDGNIVGQGIQGVATLLSGSKFAYLKSFGVGSSINIYDAALNKETQITNLPINELKLTPVAGDRIIASTKPTAFAAQQNFILDIKTKKILDFVTSTGTINISPSGKSYMASEGVSLVHYEAPYGVSQSFDAFTVSDKCVWHGVSIICASDKTSRPSYLKYPDSWYKGYFSFSDSLMFLDVQNKRVNDIYNLSFEAGELIDFYRPKISTDNKYVSFMNKRDASLWVFLAAKIAPVQ